MKKIFRKIKTRINKFTEYKNRKIYLAKDGNVLIKKMLEDGKPILISRIGATELEVLSYYVYNKKYDDYIREKAHKHAGIFPEKDSVLNKFSEEYISGIKNSDIIGVWFNKNEGKLINKYNRECNLVELRALEPYYWENPWSEYLKNKKVLVIHPFKESINSQYKKRKKIFSNSKVLPNFELKLIQAVQSMKGSNVEYVDWIESLESMKREIDKIDFDVAVIGAGGYGLPLGSYIKDKGKQAIHLGGATQIMFGIKGHRWDNHEFISKLYNEDWIRPLDKERYKGAEKVEKGCYW